MGRLLLQRAHAQVCSDPRASHAAVPPRASAGAPHHALTERSLFAFLPQPNADSQRAFVHFVLAPIYKLYAQVVGEEAPVLARTLSELGIKLKRSELHLDVKPLLKLVMSQFLGRATGFVDMVVRHVPSPRDNARNKVQRTFAGPLDGREGSAMVGCDPSGPLMINIVKCYASPDCSKFFAFGRVLSGTVKAGSRVQVRGERYTFEDSEDSAVCEVAAVSVSQARYRIDVTRVPAGNWVMLEGVDATIKKTATITDADSEDAAIFRPLQFNTIAPVKLAVEPLNPSELPKMVAGLRQVAKSYPLAQTKVEESGEHVVFATGELAMDCIMHDLREKFGKVEVKVADPVTGFRETVVETSSLRCVRCKCAIAYRSACGLCRVRVFEAHAAFANTTGASRRRRTSATSSRSSRSPCRRAWQRTSSWVPCRATGLSARSRSSFQASTTGTSSPPDRCGRSGRPSRAPTCSWMTRSPPRWTSPRCEA